MCKVLPLEFGLQECNRCHSYGNSGGEQALVDGT